MAPKPKPVDELNAREILRRFIDRSTYETQADGRMYVCCLGCDNIRWNKKITHDPDCLIVAATRMIESTQPKQRKCDESHSSRL